MFNLSRRIEYCLMTLLHLYSNMEEEGEEKKLVTVREMADKYNIPFMNVAKSVQLLSKAHFVKSVQGVHGGYYLSCDLFEVSMFELIGAVEGRYGLVKCLQGNDKTSCFYFSDCNIANSMERFNTRLVDFYKGVSVGEVICQNEDKKKNGVASTIGQKS